MLGLYFPWHNFVTAHTPAVRKHFILENNLLALSLSSVTPSIIFYRILHFFCVQFQIAFFYQFPIPGSLFSVIFPFPFWSFLQHSLLGSFVIYCMRKSSVVVGSVSFRRIREVAKIFGNSNFDQSYRILYFLYIWIIIS